MVEQSKGQRSQVPMFEPKRDVDYDKLRKLITTELGLEEGDPIPMLLLVWKGPESSRFAFYPIFQTDAWMSQYDVAIQFLRDLVSYERTSEWTQKTFELMKNAEAKKGTTGRVVDSAGRPLL